MRLENATQSPDAYMQFHMGRSLSELLAPIGDDKVGQSVRHNGVYSNIKEARKADDPTLPMGVWTYDLKTADWQEVKSIALKALSEKSKDLQLGIWLFEANLHLEGIGGIAPSALLIEQMCDNFWDNMHPQMIDGDMEYRTNPLSWINDKLTPVIKSLPITSAKLDGDELSWNDWERAQYFEKLKLQQQAHTKWDGANTQDFKQRLAATETDYFLNVIAQLDDALQAMAHLQTWLDQCCGNDSPSFTDFTGILNQINETLCQELERRGVKFTHNNDSEQNNAEEEGANDQERSSYDGGNGSHNGGDNNGTGPLNSREDAFALLSTVADFLMKDDPHSIVPYLVYTACDWGELSAPELYQEIFLQKGGQINVFDMMGIEAQ